MELILILTKINNNKTAFLAFKHAFGPWSKTSNGRLTPKTSSVQRRRRPRQRQRRRQRRRRRQRQRRRQININKKNDFFGI